MSTKLLVPLCAAVALLASCGKHDEKAGDTAPPPDTTATPAAPAETPPPSDTPPPAETPPAETPPAAKRTHPRHRPATSSVEYFVRFRPAVECPPGLRAP